MRSRSSTAKKNLAWSAVILFSGIIYLTLPYGPIIREKINKSYPPGIIDQFPLKNPAYQIKENNSTLYTNEGVQGMGVYDISQPGTIREITRIATEDTLQDFIESRKILYLAEGDAGVGIMDMEKAGSPGEISRLEVNGRVKGISLQEGYLLIAAGEQGLILADVKQIAHPCVHRQIPLSGSCRQIYSQGNIAIIGTQSAGIYIVNLENIADPQIASSVPMQHPVSALLFNDNLAFIAGSDHGIKIIDIADISAPKDISFVEMNGTIYQLSYRNGYLFAAHGSMGLTIIDINQPRHPRVVRSFKPQAAVIALETRYHFAYLADTSPNVYYIDIDAGRNSVVYSVGLILLLIFIGLLVYLIRTRASHSFYNYTALIVIMVIYGYFLKGMLEIPIEAIHFLEYGFLGVLVYRAFRHHIDDRLIFFTGTALITLIGMGDEFFQWLLPNRSWDFRDIGFNSLSGGLVQLAIWQGIAPRFCANRITMKSIVMLRNYLISVALAFAILLSMTPQFNHKIARRIPSLKFLNNPEAITEYGYKVFHPDIGGFFSRFRGDQLLNFDRTHGSEIGGILSQYQRTNYAHFLSIFTSGNSPFIHEMRVHLFRRDRYFQDKRYWVAYKENLILENFFPSSLQAGPYRWRGAEEKLCRDQIGAKADDFYVSPVSSNIITFFNVKIVWLIWTAFVLLIFTFEWLWHRYRLRR